MGYVSDFSPDGKLFALLDSDGKLKIWDTSSNRLTQEFVPNLHLCAPLTSFVWFSASAKKVRGKKQQNDDSTLYIALGTNQGRVELYSYATGKIESTLLGNGHTGAVTSICLHNESILYTSGEDYRICEWSLTKGCEVKHWSIGTKIPTCIVSLPISNCLLVGCKELFLWSLDTYKLQATFTGHSADVQSMKMIQLTDLNEEYVVTTTKLNREIYLWKIDAKEHHLKKTFLMEYAATFVSCSIVGNEIVIVAVTGTAAGGVVHLFIEDATSDTGKKRKTPGYPNVTISVASDSAARGIKPIPIVAATSNFSNSQKILIAYGGSPTLCFENIKYNPQEKKQTFERDDPRTQVNRQDKFKEHCKTIVPATNNSNTYNIGSIGVPKSKAGKKSLNSIALETSLNDRLKTLSVGDADDVAKGNSQVELLKQALHNRDAILLRAVFVNKDENVIRSTLKRLPAQYVPGLIDELTALTQKKTANVQIAVRWLKLLLQIHSSQLTALGTNELINRFGSLLGIIEHRTASFAPLTKLSGRLDFLLNQIKQNTDDDPILSHENFLVFEDEASDDASENGEADLVNGEADSDEDDIDMNGGGSSSEDGSVDMAEN